MFDFILQAIPAASELTSFGAAGLMGAMWLWERRSNRTHEIQLNTTHDRIINDRIQLDTLMDLVQQNTHAMTRLASVIESTDRKAGGL